MSLPRAISDWRLEIGKNHDFSQKKHMSHLAQDAYDVFTEALGYEAPAAGPCGVWAALPPSLLLERASRLPLGQQLSVGQSPGLSLRLVLLPCVGLGEGHVTRAGLTRDGGRQGAGVLSTLAPWTRSSKCSHSWILSHKREEGAPCVFTPVRELRAREGFSRWKNVLVHKIQI